MENYTINKNLGFVRLPFKLTSDFDDSAKDFRKTAIMDSVLSSETDAINDYEITTFSPIFETITFDIFFHRLINSMESYTAPYPPSIRTMLSAAYVEYYDKMSNYFAKTIITEYPTFWNSFGYPFYSQKQDWYQMINGEQSNILIPNRFDTKSYLYNSFIKMNFYTTPYSSSQELLFQNVVYVNPRWCEEKEGDENGSWHRPTFNLNETTDGYNIYWLNEYNIDTFYVSFQFWDALNGRMITLLPSGSSQISKQWVQTPNQNFDSRFLYLKYTLNYGTKKYAINEFDLSTLTWVLRPYAIRLYELIFNETFAVLNPNIFVQNGVPDAEATTTTTTPDFTIELDTLISDLSPTDPVILTKFSEDLSFQNIRTQWFNFVANSRYYNKDTVKIINNSLESVYLKNIEIILEDSAGSNILSRLAGGTFKNVAINSNGTNYTTYSLSSAPNYYIADSNVLQPNFKSHYHPERNVVSEDDIAKILFGNTVSVKGIDDNEPNFLKSAAFMGGYYPINPTNFVEHANDFSEQLFIVHSGNDLEAISPNGTMDLNLSWGFGKNYGYSVVEPYFYLMIHNPKLQPTTEYLVKLKYKITLFFNNLTNSLPEGANTKTFTVLTFLNFKYDNTGFDEVNGGPSQFKPPVDPPTDTGGG